MTASEEIFQIGRDLTLEVTVLKYEVVDTAPAATGLAAGIEALKARVSLAKSGQHVEYVLQVRMNGSSPWSLRRRFQQISTMHQSLRRRVASLPELPAKSVVRQFSPEYLESRKNAIAAYLKELAARRDILNCLEAQDFFGMSERDPGLRTRSLREPFHAAEVQECNFGINSFVHDATRGLLLLGASDCNWVSRMDTKLTNIKLPWEPNAPDLPSSQMTLWKESTPGSFQILFSCRFGPAISCVAMTKGEDSLCLCGLSDGAVGFQKLSAPPGASRGTTLPLLKHTAGVSALAVDEGDQWLFTASKDNSLKVYDLAKQYMLSETCSPTPSTVILFEEAHRRLFTGLQGGVVVVWDTTSLPLKLLCSIPDGSQSLSRVHALDYEASTGTLFSASKDALRIWCVKAASSGAWGRSKGTIPVMNPCTAVTWLGSSHELIAGFATGACVAFVLDGQGGPSYAWQAHEDEITALHWDEAQRRLFSASKDKRLRIWHFPAPGRELNLLATAVISSAPHLTAPRNAAQSSQMRRPSGSGSFSAVPHGAAPGAGGAGSYAAGAVPPATVSGYSEQRGPPPGEDSDDDLTGWDR